MRVVVATHGHCFDGLASAVVFTRLIRQLEGRGTELAYRACGYGAGHLEATPDVLSGDQNAILDYRFTASERLTWYFDHHRTAFGNDDERSYFEAHRETGRYFHDAACTSCTKLVAGVAREDFGVGLDDVGELIRWADVIDSAAFASPADALDRENPILRLAAVLERHGDDRMITRLVPELLERPLAEVARGEEVQRLYAGLDGQHQRFVQQVKARAVQRGRVVMVDLTGETIETIGKFVTYALYPRAVYSVVVGVLKNAAKISVGYNPWSGSPCDTDISAICARYGGGGHPVVGAVQFAATDLARAREVAHSIAVELGG